MLICFNLQYHKLVMKLLTLLLALPTVLLADSQYMEEQIDDLNYFKVAIFEHSRVGNFSEDTPAEIIQMNLHYYNLAANIAKEKEADIIVYPEYALFPLLNRTVMKNYLETIPDPLEIVSNPCIQEEDFHERVILRNLSCLARNNDIFIVANIGDIQPCVSPSGGCNCSEDGAFHYNANIVFDRQGTIISRYWKEHLFFEDGMDLPTKPQNPVFKTEVGIFAHFICFDILYKHMTNMGRDDQVDAVFFSSWWLNMSPVYNSVQLWMSWAVSNNVTLIVANAQMPGYGSTGSGVFSGKLGPLIYTFNPDGFSKLLVSRVPRSRSQTLPFHKPDADITVITAAGPKPYDEDKVNFTNYLPERCEETILGVAKHIEKEYRCFHENMENYTLVHLSEPEGHIDACNNGLCCSVNYSMEATNETFYLAVMNATFTSGNYYIDHYRWCTENCIVARCEAFNGSECAIFPNYSSTKFHRLHLTANFTTSVVYPSVVRTGMRLTSSNEWEYDLVPDKEGTFQASINVNSTSESEPLIITAFTARCFDRDPEFIR